MATSCLEMARSAESPEAEDRLLGDLLVPADNDPEDWRMRISVRVGLLRQRAAPPPGSFPYTCRMLRFGDHGAWQALLVRELLDGVSADDPSLSRALGWVEWLCRSPFPAEYDPPDWIVALACTLPRAAVEQSATDLQSLVGNDAAWAATVLRLAEGTGRTRDVLETAERALVVLAARLGGDDPAGVGEGLLSELMINTWQKGVRPDAVATVDAARIMLGGDPLDFPGDVDQRTLDRYGDGLGHVFELDAARPHHAMLENGFLHDAVPAAGAGRLTGGAVWLLNAWSADADRAPGLVRYIAELNPDALPYSPRLSTQYWSVLSREPRLVAYASAKRLIAAAANTVRSPQAALRRTVTEQGVRSTELALACFAGRRAGLPVKEIIRVLGSTLGTSIPPRGLDGVLREFQGLLYFASFNDGPHLSGPDPGHASEADLDECHQRIMHGAFGAEYGRAFAAYQEHRLRADIRTRQGKLRRIPRRQRRHGKDTVPVNPAGLEPAPAAAHVVDGEQAPAGPVLRPERMWWRLLAWPVRKFWARRQRAQERRQSRRQQRASYRSPRSPGDGD